MMEEEQSRETAYSVLITVSILATVFSMMLMSTTVPLLNQFSDSINTQLGEDAAYCDSTASDILSIYHGMALNETRDKRESTKDETCLCENPSGAVGVPGRDGLRGPPGSEGAPGMPARLPCEPPRDIKKLCPDPCPQGVQGEPGPVGITGDKGPVGIPGRDGIRGIDGSLGKKGDTGPRGIPGLGGERGEAGEDATPQPFIPGPPGEQGDEGERGPSGPPGMPGIDGPIGPAGPRGRKGKDGFPGAKGDAGLEGPLGDEGTEGNKGVCPTYCATDGGVFFVQPPDWFFD